MENTQKPANPSSKALRRLPDGRTLTREQLWPEMRARYEAGECGIASLVQLYGVPRPSIKARMERDKNLGYPWTKASRIPPPVMVQTQSNQVVERLQKMREEHFDHYSARFTELRALLVKTQANLTNSGDFTAKEVQTLIDAQRKLHEMERTHLGLDQVTESREGLGDISSLGLFDGANITIQPAAKAEVQGQIVEVESHVTQDPA